MKKILKIAFIVLNILFAIALLASSFAGNVKPSTSLPIAMMSYAYFYLLIINAIFVLIWLCLRSRVFLISLIVIILKINYIPRFFQLGGNETCEVSEEDNTLKVMTFNVYRFRWCDTASRGTLNLIDAEQPDIVCFQEFSVKLSYDIVQCMRERGYKYRHSVIKSAETVSGTTIFSKYPIVDKEVMPTGINIYVDILKNGETIRIYSVHLDSYRLNDKDKSNINHMTHGEVDETDKGTLRKFKKALLSHEDEVEVLGNSISNSPYPVILCGDFNDPPASYSYNYINKYLSDSFCEQGSGTGDTYDGKFPAFRIDYIFHDDCSEVLSYKKIETGISDHYPVIVTVKIKSITK